MPAKKKSDTLKTAVASLFTKRYNIMSYNKMDYSQAALNSVQTRTCSSSASGVMF